MESNPLINNLITLIFVSTQLIYCLSASLSSSTEVNKVNSTQNRVNNGTNSNATLKELDFPQSDDPSSWPMMMDMGQPFRSIDLLGSSQSQSLLCAIIYTTSYCSLNVPDNGVHFDISNQQFVFYTANIMDQCHLTIVDNYGTLSTTSQLPYPGYNWPVTNSVCCECGGCERRTFPPRRGLCAILFENWDCSSCHGFRLEVEDGDEIAVMNDFVNDKVSSLFVVSGCSLTVFKGCNFLGEGSIATGSLNLPYDWNDVISSFKCSCSAEVTFPPALTTAKMTTSVPTTITTTTPLPVPPRTTTSIPLATTAAPDPTTTAEPEVTTTPIQIITTTTTSPTTTTATSPPTTTIATSPPTMPPTTKEVTTTTTAAPTTTTTTPPTTTSPPEEVFPVY